MRYAINSPTVVGEIIDDEAVILNLQSGQYFNTTGTGAAIWAGLEQGSTADALTERLHAHFDVERPQAFATVTAFLAVLDHHGLIRTLSADATRTVPPPAAATRAPFVAPELGVHSDLDDMLRLDPIHDVDPAGWPIANRAG